LLFYSKEIKDVVKYDGYKWIAATEKSIKNYKNLAILGSNTADQSVANVLGITGRPTLQFNVLNDIDRNIVNNLGVTVNANGEITIPSDGFYRINPSVKTSSAGGLSVGNAATIISRRLFMHRLQETDGKKFMKTVFYCRIACHCRKC
jgi:protein involved in polysaccharide export with SLBB domain